MVIACLIAQRPVANSSVGVSNVLWIWSLSQHELPNKIIFHIRDAMAFPLDNAEIKSKNCFQ